MRFTLLPIEQGGERRGSIGRIEMGRAPRVVDPLVHLAKEAKRAAWLTPKNSEWVRVSKANGEGW
jgi:hypothetical protein